MSAVVRVGAEQERELIEAVLVAAGAPAAPAALQAGWLLEGDLRGHASHGLQRLPVLVERVRRGLIDPAAEPRLSWAGPALGVLEGGRAFGPVAGCHAVDAACERARETGAAVVAVRDCNHLGLLAPYVERAAARGLIGIVLTTSEALVHPWGGARPMVGTNPIAIAVPAAPEPFVLDMATGATSRGKVLAHARSGAPLQDGWAVDAAGRPTTDARAALDGAISPFGGPKGFALGLALELLVGVLTATALGDAVTGTLDAETICNKGDVVICIDPARGGGGAGGAGAGAAGGDARDDGAARASAYLDALRATAPAEGTAGVSIPGDGARARRAAALRDGVELTAGVWEEAVRLCAGTSEETSR